MKKRNDTELNSHSNGIARFANEGQPSTDIHTEELHEIITKVPSWIIRWGISLFFSVLLMSMAISVFVHYPDAVKRPIKLETFDLPVVVSAANAGRITKLIAEQGMRVKQGQTLATVATSNNIGSLYSIVAPQDGELGFVGIVEKGSAIMSNQQVFVIHPAHDRFFGIMEIPADKIGRIKIGQQVLINLPAFPEEEYGKLNGVVSYVADEPGKNGRFSVKITLNNESLKHKLKLRDWVTGDAEIMTDDVSLENRLMRILHAR